MSSKFNVKKVNYWVIITFALAMQAILFYPSIGNDSAIGDEMTTLAFCMRPIREILNISSNPMDLAPPSYLLFVKGLSSIIRFINPSVSYVTAIKLASFIPFSVAMCVAIRWFCNITDNIGGIVCAIVFLHPSFIRYCGYNRIYTWAMLFCLLAIISSYYIMKGNTSCKQWICFTVWVIVASSIHYIAAIICALVLIMIYFATVKYTISKKPLCVSVLFVVVAYAALFFGRIKLVINDIWQYNVPFIVDDKSNSLFDGYLGYFIDVCWSILASDYSFYHLAGIIGGIWLAVAICVIIKFYLDSTTLSSDRYIWGGYVFIGCIMIFISALIMCCVIHMSATRYYYASLPFIWLPVAWLIRRYLKIEYYWVIVLLFILQIPEIIYYTKNENQIKNEFGKVYEDVICSECRYVVDDDVHIAIALTVYKEIYDAPYSVVAIESNRRDVYCTDKAYSDLYGFELIEEYKEKNNNDIIVKSNEKGKYLIESNRFDLEESIDY